MKEFPTNKPTESGYYMTIYKNSENGNLYYKPIIWDNDKQEWVPWNKLYAPEVLS